MSVRHYTARELAAVVACATAGHGPRFAEMTAGILAKYSKKNTAAYNASYKDRAEAATKQQILAAIRPAMRNTQYCKDAGCTASLLAYNAIDQKGKNHMTSDLAQNLLWIVGRFACEK